MFTYIKIAVLAAAVTLGAYGAWYIQGIRLDKLKAEITTYKAEIVSYKRAMEIYEHDAELDQAMAKEKDRVSKLTPDELDMEFDKLRTYGNSPKD
jgi:hypothetical protein